MASGLENGEGNLYNYAPFSAFEVVLTLKWPPVTRTLCELLNIVSFCKISFVVSVRSGGLGIRDPHVIHF